VFVVASVSSMHIFWNENSSPKSDAKMAGIEEVLHVSSSPFLLFLSARLKRRVPKFRLFTST
jgi:hypothetical protein